MNKWITNNTKKVLLIDPAFPVSRKSRNHKDLLPIGLLKIGSFLKNNNIETRLIRLNPDYDIHSSYEDFVPDLVLVTSVFTYWAKYVKDAVKYSKNLYPNVPVIVGGIYASLLPENCKKFTGCDDIHFGVIEEAEGIKPDYSLLGEEESEIDYQIIHTTRGCIRRCGCCGVYQIETEFSSKKSIKDEIIRKKLVFYDNNLLANPFITEILNEIIELRSKRKLTSCESQSGFDGRILVKNPEIASLLREANFKNPKLAWDGPYNQKRIIKKQLDVLIDSGYSPKEISVFMIYNHDLDYEEMEKKRVKCWKWQVQISDCRYRPLDRTDDEYNPYSRKPQTNDNYHINPNWTDELVREFRRNVRKHNICVRHEIKYYSNLAERKKISKSKSLEYRNMEFKIVKKYLRDAWDPGQFHKVGIQKKLISK